MANKPPKPPKAPKAATAPGTAPATATAAPAPLYGFGPRAAKYSGTAGTKHGTAGNGTAGTWAAVQALVTANPAGVTLAQVRAVCVQHGDPGFAGYAVNKLRVLAPIAPATPTA